MLSRIACFTGLCAAWITDWLEQAPCVARIPAQLGLGVPHLDWTGLAEMGATRSAVLDQPRQVMCIDSMDPGVDTIRSTFPSLCAERVQCALHGSTWTQGQHWGQGIGAPCD